MIEQGEGMTPRRGFLARLMAAGAVLGVPGMAGAGQARAQPPAEPWAGKVKGTHRVVFHSHEPTNGLAFGWARNFLNTQRDVYGGSDADSTVIVGLNGRAVGMLYNDAMWAKYPMAKVLGVPHARNPWQSVLEGSGVPATDTIPALTARGVLVLACNNSLRMGAIRFHPDGAKTDEATRRAFYEEVKANLVPGVEVVPAMIVTLQRAQGMGCGYVYAGQ
jgi:intracellular sulfur oxidation DsrE/DsrF family protein